MEVEFELTLDDVEAFARFHVRSGPRVKPRRRRKVLLPLLALSLSLGLAPLLLPLLFPNAQSDTILAAGAWFFTGALLTLFGLVALGRYSIIQTTLRLYENEQCRWYFARRRVKIAPDGIESTSGQVQTRYDWSTIWLIKTTPEHAFLYMTYHLAHIIPRRAFRDREHFEEFVDLATRYQQGQDASEVESADILDALPARPTGITRPPST